MAQDNPLKDKRITLAKNPLGIISLFVFFIEAIATVSLSIAVETDYAGHIIWFITLFPTLIVFLFFGTLWIKRESLYAPMDYSDPQAFQKLLRPMEQKVDQIAAKQEAAEIDPVTAELKDVFITIGKLTNLGDIRSAIELGRAYLKKDNYTESTEIFSHLRENVENTNESYYRILANLAYSLIGQGKYEEAIGYLTEVKKNRGGSKFRVWHSLAIAYSYNKLGKSELYNEWLEKSKKKPEYKRNTKFFKSLYSDIRNDL